jgi:ribose transport system ATP-binding protein
VKSFGGVQALAGATLVVKRASVCGLVGQNGAGKSTLIKILAGLYGPRIRISPLAFSKPKSPRTTSFTPEPQEAGQPDDLALSDREGDVAEPTRRGQAIDGQDRLRDRDAPLRKEVLDVARDHQRGDGIRGNCARIDDRDVLPVAENGHAVAQVLDLGEIVRNVHDRDPFASEPADQREEDFRFSCNEGGGRLIEHERRGPVKQCARDLNDLFLSSGEFADQDSRRQIEAEIIAQNFHRLKPHRAAINQCGKSAHPRLAAKEERLADRKARREQSVLMNEMDAKALPRLRRQSVGNLTVDQNLARVGSPQASLHSPKAAVDAGLAFVPEDRRSDGVGLRLSVLENTTLASLGRFSRRGLMRRSPEIAEVDRLVGNLSIRAASRNSLVRTLSGGNQQKVVLAKWLSRQSGLYILDEPTIGVDVGSKTEIYQLIGDLVERGAGVLILPELLGLADRILVMYRGEISREFEAASATATEILAEATGAAEVRNVG